MILILLQIFFFNLVRRGSIPGRWLRGPASYQVSYKDPTKIQHTEGNLDSVQKVQKTQKNYGKRQTQERLLKQAHFEMRLRTTTPNNRNTCD